MSFHYHAAKLAVRGFIGLLSGWRVQGTEHVPRSGGVIVASNHTSFWDPPMVGCVLDREAYFLGKEELFSTPLVGALVRGFNAIPIRRGTGDLRGMSRALEVLRQGNVLILFPEGGRMRDGELHPARPGVGMIAVQADVPIVPCYVYGSSRPRLWLTRRLQPGITMGPARDWRELAGAAAEEPPGRRLYQPIGDGVMLEIGRLKVEWEEHLAARSLPRRQA